MEKNAELMKKSSEIIKRLDAENKLKNQQINELSEKVSMVEKKALIEKCSSIMINNDLLDKEDVPSFMEEMTKLSVEQITTKIKAFEELGIDDETGTLGIGKTASADEVPYNPRNSLRNFLYS